MPARKKRSKAATQREQNKRNDNDSILPNSSFENMQSTLHYSVVSGTLHQGDVRFQYPGVQCTFISFWALVLMENKSPLLWNATDIDSCIVDGNDRFIKHCFKSEIQPRQLLVKELPQSTDAYNSLIQLSQFDSGIKAGTLNQPKSIGATNAVFISIEEAILGCFHTFNSCFLVCGGQTVAIAKRQNRFFVFDSHSRGKDGLLHHTGNAVLVSFIKIQDLIDFVKKLFIESLRLKPAEQFELVPVTIFKRYHSIDKVNGSVSSIVNTGPSIEPALSCREPDTSNPNEQALNLSDVSKHEARKDYMRVYMQRRRDVDSFRKKAMQYHSKVNKNCEKPKKVGKRLTSKLLSQGNTR